MIKFQISPSKDFVIIKWLFAFLSGVIVLFTLSTWVMLAFNMWDMSEGLIAAIIMSVFSLMIIYSTLLFVNYDISFLDDSIIITSWIGKKRSFQLSDLKKTVYRYRIYTTYYTVFVDNDGNKLFKTKYGKKRYFDYLESIGFEIEKPNNASMIF